MTGQGLIVERVEGGVLHLCIDRPDAANALTPDLRDRLAAAFEEAARDRDVRAVLLSARGSRHFCTGAGLASQGAPPPVSEVGDVARLLQHGWQRLVRAVLECDKPVVAAVAGAAAGAGTSLVLACDLVVMAEAATFVPVFARRGIVPDAGNCHLLARVVGLRRASELLMLGDPLSAQECLSWGIANRVVPGDALGQVAGDLAARLAGGPTVSLGLTKRLLLSATNTDREQAFEREAWAQEIASASADMKEGLAAFAERRSPRFAGR